MTFTVADLPPAVAVIVAVPALTAVTVPEASTVATDVSEDLHDTARSVAFAGETVAEILLVEPTGNWKSPPAIDTDDTGTVTGSPLSTITVTEADLPPAVAVIVAVPTAFAITLPEASTDATDAFEERQLTARSVAFDGETVAESCFEAPV